MSSKFHVEMSDKLHLPSDGYIDLLQKIHNATAYELTLAHLRVTIYC
jgi:hypothetical protein